VNAIPGPGIFQKDHLHAKRIVLAASSPEGTIVASIAVMHVSRRPTSRNSGAAQTEEDQQASHRALVRTVERPYRPDVP